MDSRASYPGLNFQLVLEFELPRVRGSASLFLRIPEFESHKFLRLIKIPVFSLLKFSYFEPRIFLKFYTKNTFRAIILDFCIKC